MNVDTSGSSFDTLLAVYSGESLTTLTPIASNDDADFETTSSLTFLGVAGQVYHIAVDGLDGQTGFVALNIHPGVSITRHPQSRTLVLGTNVSLSVSTSEASDLQFQWRKNGVDLPGATNSVLAITNVNGTHAAAYSVLVRAGAIGTVSSNAVVKVIPPYHFTTWAGTPVFGHADGTASLARFRAPSAVASDPAGNIYVADTGNHTVRKIAPNGVVTTLAGLAETSGSQNGVGNAARFAFPFGVTIDGAGGIYVADSFNNQIRKIAADGTVSTWAGSVSSRPGNSDGIGTLARFQFPTRPAVNAAGNVFVADTLNHTIRKITAAAVVSTLAGLAGTPGSNDGSGNAARFSYPRAVAVDATGNVYVADSGNSTIRKITSGGTVATLAGLPGTTGSQDGFGSEGFFTDPTAITVDAAGNVYVADSYLHTIRKITAAGLVTTLAGSSGNSGSTDGTGNLARFNTPTGLAADAGDNIYVADTGNNTIRKITPLGVVSTLAGRASVGSVDASGNAAAFGGVDGMAVDAADNVYVSDSGNHTIRKISPLGMVSTLAGQSGIAGQSDGKGSEARFDRPESPAVDSAGNVYVPDAWNHTIRKITPDGMVSTLAGLADNPGSADGIGPEARFFYPFAVAVDAAGLVYVADGYNNTIRKITPSGSVSTLAGMAGQFGHTDGFGRDARFNGPEGLAVDSTGNLFVADYGNHVIRKVTPDGRVKTFAGHPEYPSGWDGTGSDAYFDHPSGVAIDRDGNLFVSDSGNNAIRMITPEGVVSTLGGSPWDPPGSDDGTGEAARFSTPFGIGVDSQGNIYVADSGNDTIRKGAPVISIKTAQTIDFAALPGRVFGDGPLSLSATASSGLPVSFAIRSGPATISGNLLAVNGAGTITIRASQAGNADFAAAPDVERFLVVAKAEQSIIFGSIGDRTLEEGPFDLSATANSGLPASFAILDGPATLSGTRVILSGTGVVTVRASQPGNENYHPAAPVDQSFTVSPFNLAPTAILKTESINVAGRSTHELAVTYSDDRAISISTLDSQDIRVVGPNDYGQLALFEYLDIGGDGTPRTAYYRIAAPGDAWINTANGTYTVLMAPNQVGDTSGTFVTAGSLGSFQVNVPPPPIVVPPKISQTIDFPNLSGRTFGDPPFEITATASSGLLPSFTVVSGPATISGNRVTLTGAGPVAIRASQEGNTNYTAAPDIDRLFEVAKAGQIISFGTIGEKTFGDAPFPLEITTSSGLPASVMILSGPATITGNTVTLTGTGSVTVRAVQAGNENFHAAPDLDQAFLVSPVNRAPLATLSVESINQRGVPTQRLTVTYADDTSIKSATVDGNDIRVEGPNNFNQLAALESLDIAGDGTPRTAVYRISAPAGEWAVTANGTYTVHLESNQVSDTRDAFVEAGILGTFQVNVPNPPVISAPTILTAPQSQTIRAGSTLSFSVVAEGAGPLSYQWRRNGLDIEDALGSMLELRNLQDADAGDYSVVVSNAGGQTLSAPARLTVLPPEPPRPANDDFDNRVRLTGVSISIAATNTNASGEPGEPSHAGKPAVRSLWWSWTTLQSGLVTVTTSGSGIDTLVGVYQGTAIEDLTLVASNDDAPTGGSTSQLTFRAEAGTEYLIAVDAFGGESGAIQLGLTLEVSRPSLRVELSGKNLVLAWSTNLVGFVIEASDSLPNPQWNEVPLTPVVVGDSHSAKLPITTGIRFYRLRSQ